LLISFAASNNLVLEGADISNAYLYGKLDVPFVMKEPTNSSLHGAAPGHVCIPQSSLYGAKQAGKLWRSLLSNTLLDWNFRISNVDARLYFLREGVEFVIIANFVDDLVFASHSASLMERLNQRLAVTLDFKLFGALTSFIGWKLTRTNDGIIFDQRNYAKGILERSGMAGANVVKTPLPLQEDFLPAYRMNHNYRQKDTLHTDPLLVK